MALQDSPRAAMAAALLGLSVAAAPAAAQRADSTTLLIRLGTDTTAIERYVRTAEVLEATVVQRSPRTVVRRLRMWFGPEGTVTRFAAGGETGELREETPAVTGGVPLVGGFNLPWELALMRAHRSGRDSVVVQMISGGNALPITFRRVGEGEWAFNSQFDQPMRARLDAQGRLQRMEILGGGATTERVAWVDIEALARGFAARDAAGSGLGPLSPRDSTSATVAGARISVSYGRPSLRGRELNVLAPPGQVWRTGANDASTLTTDRALQFGSLTVPPGTYSLFTIPGADRWTLILNRQTGMSGLEHDPAQDLGRVEMMLRSGDYSNQFTISVQAQGRGGVLRMHWGRTIAEAGFSVN